MPMAMSTHCLSVICICISGTGSEIQPKANLSENKTPEIDDYCSLMPKQMSMGYVRNLFHSKCDICTNIVDAIESGDFIELHFDSNYIRVHVRLVNFGAFG